MYGFKQLIKKATRLTDRNESLIDIIATNNSQNISKAETISLSFSDHEMVGCTRKLNHKTYEQKTIYCRDYKIYDHIKINDDQRVINWHQLYELDNVNDERNFFKMCVSKIFDKHAPLTTKRIRGKQCAWMNDEIKSHMNTRDKLFRK